MNCEGGFKKEKNKPLTDEEDSSTQKMDELKCLIDKICQSNPE